MDKELLHDSIYKNTVCTFSRSSGPGGQNVNKVNSKVHASLAISVIEGLSPTEICLLRKKLSNITNKDGCLIVVAQDERDQDINKQNALLRMEQKIINALKFKKPRKATKPTKASKEQRLKSKKIRSQAKIARRKISDI